ncbi:MAG: hypothetical protein LBT14_02755, partial [Treponema sp.]|nr:hypothetical protein [Treponema sp.]
MAIEYSVICLEPHFVIKNESSHEQNIELTSVYIYKQRIRLNKEWTQSRSLDSGEETELETWDSYFGPEKYILSFLFIIDRKNYAGWASTEGNFGIDIIEYELGYVNTQE